MDNQKIIVFDFLVYCHIVGYAKAIPEYGTKYQILNMMVSHLKKIGLNKNDIIIVAKDKIRGIDGGCWRFAYEKEYKHGRADAREKSGRNWNLIWQQVEELQEELEWIGIKFIELPTFEADDIMAVLPMIIKDKEIILITTDGDLEQCFVYPNVKIFSPKREYKTGKGAYKIKPDNFDINKFIAKKIRKEVSDGLDKEIVTEEDYDNRKICVDLINLPDFVVQPLTEIIKATKFTPNYDWEEMPYYDKFMHRIEQAYKKEGIMTYEECVDYYAKKELKKKKKAKLAKQKEA